MPRIARIKSESGFYHIMVRGINRQDIFHDDEDRRKYLSVLKKYGEKCGCNIYGYCLMNNHVHLLLREIKDPIESIMKRIGASYVYWYNNKYDRVGHLFQDRFKSEAVEDENYLLSVIRYIHQNPLKAKFGKGLDYKWSSYNEYIGEKGKAGKAGKTYEMEIINDPDFIFEIFHTDKNKALELFEKFMAQDNKDSFLDNEQRKKPLHDEDVKIMLKDIAGLESTGGLISMEKKNRNLIIRKMKNKGVSIRQLSRITGINRGIIGRA